MIPIKTDRILLLLTAFALLSAPPVRAQGPRDSVVKVFVTVNPMDFYRPWQAQGSESGTGSGFVIEGKRILTNAHVVSDSTFIQVRKESNPEKFTARLEAIGHDCDLAVLAVDDPKFFEGIQPVRFGDLPKLQDSVAVIGFPEGGDKLSITEGVVSRVEIIPYTQSSKKLLGVQIDAAINPGNSGGPVFQEGKVVGVAMQLMSTSQNIGYMIPTPIIEHFLGDLKDGSYEGFPTLGVQYSDTENKGLREYLRLGKLEGGVLINRVFPFSSVDGVLEEGDVILEADGIPVGVDGTFDFRQDERLAMSYLINRKHIGDTMKFKIFRKGRTKNIDVKLKDFVQLVPEPHYFKKPTYYIYGGLVFTVLSTDLMKSWGQRWWEKAPYPFLHYQIGNGSLNPDGKREIVVLLNVLPDDLNVGYHGHRFKVIRKVNGKEFDSFREFVLMLEKAPKGFTVIDTESRFPIILKNEDINELTTAILSRNSIPARYSEDVGQWLEGDR